MVVVMMYDLFIFCGYWESGDLMLGKVLGFYFDEVVLCGLYQDCELVK